MDFIRTYILQYCNPNSLNRTYISFYIHFLLIAISSYPYLKQDHTINMIFGQD